MVDLVGRWVALLDEAEALLAAAVADPDAPTARRLHRSASQTFDTLSASEHEMTPDTRRGARAYVWRRDHATDEPLPDEAVLKWWEQCLCRRCHAARVLGRPVGDGPAARPTPAAPSTAAATPVPWTSPTPQVTQVTRDSRVTPTRRPRAVQATLFPAASRQRRQRRQRHRQTQWMGS